MSKLLNFYKQIIENVGLYVDDDGYIWFGSDDDKVLITVGGKSMVLPTKEHLNSIYSTDDSGNVITNKVIFNPINEDIVKGDSTSIKMLKKWIEAKLGHIVASAGESLLILAANKELQQKTKFEINKFLAEINRAQNIGIKQLVDDKSIDNWINIYSKSVDSTKGMFSIYLKKKGKYDGEDYNRLAVLSSEVLNQLESGEKEPQVYDIKLRKKDATIFSIIFKYLIDEFDDDNNVCVGSNDSESPAFISLMSIYLKIVARTNKILKHLAFVNQQTADNNIIKNLLTVDSLYTLREFKSETIQLPNENDLNRGILEAESRIKSIPSNNLIGKQQPMPSQPIMKNETAKETVNEDPVAKALYGGVKQQQAYYNQMHNQGPIGINSAIMPQQPMGYNQPMGFQQPIGINSIQQPYMGFGQPMGYQQPNISNPMSYYPNNSMNMQPMQNIGYQQPMGYNNHQQPYQQQTPNMSLDIHANPYK